jgi:glycosyl transferase family 25
MNLRSIKVISLDRSEVRRNQFIEMNEGLDYEFISAIDGSVLDKKTIEDNNLFGPGLNYTAGARGCALSHLNLWDLAIAEDQVLTIAEDDAIFREDFFEKADEVISLLPNEWDIVFWGWNFDSILSVDLLPDTSKAVMVFDQAMLRNSIPNFRKIKTHCLPMRLDKCLGTPAYSISPIGAKKFKSMCFPLSPFTLEFPQLKGKLPNTGIDFAMNRIYSSTNSFVCLPPLVVTKNEHNISTVQTSS